MDDFEYVTQHFGFTPKAFVDGIYNAVNDYIKGFFKEMGKVLDEEFAKGDTNLSSTIRQECKKLIAKCYESVDKNMDKMETYLLKNIFVIPAGVLLPEDEVHKAKGIKDENSLTEAALDNEILEVKTEILKEIRYRELLQCEQEKLKIILGELKRLEDWFERICSEVNQHNLKDAIELVSTNSVKIMDLLESQKETANR